MSAIDERLVVLRLCKNWCGRVERGELDVQHVWPLLRERVAAVDPAFAACPICGQTPCPDPGFCESCRSADQKIQACRKCAQCGAGGDLDPHQWKEKRTIVYLHRGACERFWKSRNR